MHIITTDVDAIHAALRSTTRRDDAVIVHSLPLPYSNGMSYRRRIAAFVQFAVAGSVMATRVRADLVLATSTPLTVAIPGLIASKLRGIPFVFEVRDLWPELPIAMGALEGPASQALARRLAETTYRHADRVIALSPGMASGVAAYGYPTDKITVVSNGCDLDLFSRVDSAAVRTFRESRPWLGDRPLVVYAGTIGPINGVDYIVKLAAEVWLRNRDVRFLILGEGREQHAVTELARMLGVFDRNLFMEPPVPKMQMPTVLAAADLAMSVFRPVRGMWDNSANKFFDALAAGRPIAINHGGWQADLLGTYGAGLVLSESDLPRAAADVTEALADPDWRRGAGVAARRLADEQFARDQLFDRFEQVLLDALAAPSSGVGRRHPVPSFRRRSRRVS